MKSVKVLLFAGSFVQRAIWVIRIFGFRILESMVLVQGLGEFSLWL